jgi:hypothetical protein
MSTWSYLLFNDEPLQSIESCKHGIIIGNIACGNETPADDLTLVVAVYINKESGWCR